mgnify:FL=1
MTKRDCILAIDQGTTSTRSIVFDSTTKMLSIARREFPQYYPEPGWVEHDAEEIWKDVLDTAREALADAGGTSRVAGIGITNQRETTVIWERSTGKPIHRAIVWQDRRTAQVCNRLKQEGAEPLVRSRTGLMLDPYFSGSKIARILDNEPGARTRAEAGGLAAGKTDSSLLKRPTCGRVDG